MASLDWFGAYDLAATNAWQLIANLAHVGDPLLLQWSAWSDVGSFAAGDGALDTDDDGLTDARELLLSLTNPQAADSDGDGLSDGAEFLQYASNPNRVDSAGDGLNDAWKVANGFDPGAWLDPIGLAPTRRWWTWGPARSKSSIARSKTSGRSSRTRRNNFGNSKRRPPWCGAISSRKTTSGCRRN